MDFRDVARLTNNMLTCAWTIIFNSFTLALNWNYAISIFNQNADVIGIVVDVYPKAKEKIGNSVSSYSSESAISSNGYVVDYDSDTMIEVGSCIRDDDI
jgi:hypothetical protein